ncbi:MAG: hypothetical protein ACRCZI_12890, partial [Cetobacterium sp.]
ESDLFGSDDVGFYQYNHNYQDTIFDENNYFYESSYNFDNLDIYITKKYKTFFSKQSIESNFKLRFIADVMKKYIMKSIKTNDIDITDFIFKIVEWYKLKTDFMCIEYFPIISHLYAKSKITLETLQFLVKTIDKYNIKTPIVLYISISEFIDQNYDIKLVHFMYSNYKYIYINEYISNLSSAFKKNKWLIFLYLINGLNSDSNLKDNNLKNDNTQSQLNIIYSKLVGREISVSNLTQDEIFSILNTFSGIDSDEIFNKNDILLNMRCLYVNILLSLYLVEKSDNNAPYHFDDEAFKVLYTIYVNHTLSDDEKKYLDYLIDMFISAYEIYINKRGISYTLPFIIQKIEKLAIINHSLQNDNIFHLFKILWQLTENHNIFNVYDFKEKSFRKCNDIKLRYILSNLREMHLLQKKSEDIRLTIAGKINTYLGFFENETIIYLITKNGNNISRDEMIEIYQTAYSLNNKEIMRFINTLSPK